MKNVTVNRIKLEQFLQGLKERVTPDHESQTEQDILMFMEEIVTEQRKNVNYDDLIRKIQSYSGCNRAYLESELDIRMNKFPHGSLTELVVNSMDSDDYLTLLEIENPTASDLEFLEEVKEKLLEYFD
ncbi:hypothetical protein SAMN04488048_102152 [Trichococcus flocculiformis]|uniref:hypothetical protein n=1 Tax=Trichococcus TaxID=82802 RepID=UPI0007A821FA|nr:MULTISPECIES: hypothetical protein [Trichococcus]CZQ86737.1 Hypothetical protein TES5_546 [Trichococcus sp. ES5]SHF27122.1 hypothetical protein SAMN04488048_102152 [Trichococcus flocculiformis]